MRRRIAYLILLTLVFSVFAPDPLAAQNNWDGKWTGKIAFDDDSRCSTELSIQSAVVKNNEFTLVFRDENSLKTLTGKIDAAGEFSEWQSLDFVTEMGISHRQDFKFSGQFEPDSFDGSFFANFGYRGVVCTGRLKLVRIDSDLHKQQLAAAAAKRAPFDPDKIDGKWTGKIAFDDDSSCSAELIIESVVVKNNELTLAIRNANSLKKLTGKINAAGEFSEWQRLDIITGKGRPYNPDFKFSGQFAPDSFDGGFDATFGPAKAHFFCAGTLQLTRIGSDRHKQQLAAVAAAKQTPLKPDQIEGKWGGEIIASAGEECSFERQELRAAVSGGSFTGQARIGNTQHNFQGKVGSNADALIYAELPITGIGDNVKVRLKGRFTDKGFDGYFYGDNGRSSDFGRCSGTVKLARLGDWKRQAAQLKAKEDAEHAKLESEKQEVDRLAKLVAQAKAKKAALEAKQQDQTLSAQLTAERQATERLTAALAEQKARLAKFEEDKRREKAKSRQVAARSNLPPEIEQLKQIAKSGLIDQKEFQARKKAILDRIFGAVPASATSTIANIKFGKYHALVIGIDAYRNLPRLKTAVADAKAVTKELKDNYGFEVTELINPTRDQMLDTMDDLQASLTFKDNLLIYYAGHGWLNEKSDQGYWLPIDAKKNRRSRWVSNSTLTDTLTALEAKHVMVVADSCYSGRLVRSANVNIENASSAEYYQQMSRKKARVVITSGGLEPVEDGKGEHSPFARAFLSALSKNNSVIDGTKLFNAIRRPVMVNADQTPQYSDVRRAGHDGGDFLFVRRK